MASPDISKENKTEGYQNPENGRIFAVDPLELVRGNPAANIISPEIYNRLEHNFSIEAWDKPQVVRVLTPLPDGKETTRYFVLDGLNRTKFAADHPEIIQRAKPDFVFEVKDVTATFLHDLTVVHRDEQCDDQQALTWLQYLRAVIPSTRAHQEIVPGRIAGHLMNGWNNMVGPEIAAQYSATAALGFLATKSSLAPSILETQLKKETILVNETQEQKQRIIQAFLEMAEVIQLSNLRSFNVARAALELVAKLSPAIGGEQAAIRNIYGMLHTPEIEKKLASVPEGTSRERVRDELARTILTSLGKVVDSVQRENLFDNVPAILEDQRLNLSQVSEVFAAEQPVQKYSEVKKGYNRKLLRRIYLEVSKKPADNLTSTEVNLLERLGFVMDFKSVQPATIARNIIEANKQIMQTSQFIENLVANRGALVQRGVDAVTIDEAIGKLKSNQRSVFSSITVGDLNFAKQQLEVVYMERRKSINVQQNSYLVDRLVEHSFTDTRAGTGSLLGQMIYRYIMRNFSIRDRGVVLNEQEVREIQQRIQDLTKLDRDLQSEVIEEGGLMTIKFALAKQKERDERSAKAAIPPKPIASVPEKPIVAVVPSAPSQQVPVRPPEMRTPLPTTRPDIIEQPIISEGENEKRRLDELNRRLQREIGIHLRPFVDAIQNYDLDYGSISPTNLNSLSEAMKVIGKFGWGYPDIIAQIKDKQERIVFLEEQNRLLRVIRIDRDLEDAQKDARTGR